jgi:hypothetical protein
LHHSRDDAFYRDLKLSDYYISASDVEKEREAYALSLRQQDKSERKLLSTSEQESKRILPEIRGSRDPQDTQSPGSPLPTDNIPYAALPPAKTLAEVYKFPNAKKIVPPDFYPPFPIDPLEARFGANADGGKLDSRLLPYPGFIAFHRKKKEMLDRKVVPSGISPPDYLRNFKRELFGVDIPVPYPDTPEARNRFMQMNPKIRKRIESQLLHHGKGRGTYQLDLEAKTIRRGNVATEWTLDQKLPDKKLNFSKYSPETGKGMFMVQGVLFSDGEIVGVAEVSFINSIEPTLAVSVDPLIITVHPFQIAPATSLANIQLDAATGWLTVGDKKLFKMPDTLSWDIEKVTYNQAFDYTDAWASIPLITAPPTTIMVTERGFVQFTRGNRLVLEIRLLDGKKLLNEIGYPYLYSSAKTEGRIRTELQQEADKAGVAPDTDQYEQLKNEVTKKVYAQQNSALIMPRSAATRPSILDGPSLSDTESISTSGPVRPAPPALPARPVRPAPPVLPARPVRPAPLAPPALPARPVAPDRPSSPVSVSTDVSTLPKPGADKALQKVHVPLSLTREFMKMAPLNC